MPVRTHWYVTADEARFASRPVPEEHIHHLLRLATPDYLDTPSLCTFAVFNGAETIRGFSEAAKLHLLATASTAFTLDRRTDHYADPEYHLFHYARTVIVLYVAGTDHGAFEAAGIAAEAIRLHAATRGLTALPVDEARRWFDLPEIKIRFSVPPEYKAVIPLALGYAEGTPPPGRDRDPEIVAWVSGHG